MAKVITEKIIKSGKSDGNWLVDLPTFIKVNKNCFYKLNVRKTENPSKNDSFALILVFNKKLLNKTANGNANITLPFYFNENYNI